MMRLYHRIGIAFLCAALSLCAACSPTAEITSAPTAETTPGPTAGITPAPTAGITPAPTAETTPAPTAGITPAPTAGITPAPTAGITPASTPTPTPAPWEADPGRFILDNLNAAFSDGRLGVRVFFNNGSGPAGAAMLDSECGQDIRNLFSAYDWKAAQRPQEESIPFDSFSVEFYDRDAPYYIWFSTYSDVLCLSSAGDSSNWLYFSANGAKNLCRDFTALCPHPIIQCALVSSTAQKTAEKNARQFMDDLFAVMAKNGHIADYEVFELDILGPSDMLTFDPSDVLTFNVCFRMKAAHPERDLWASGSGQYPADESGWTDTIKWMVCLSADPEQGIYRLDWIG